jgi:hypothetical protein
MFPTNTLNLVVVSLDDIISEDDHGVLEGQGKPTRVHFGCLKGERDQLEREGVDWHDICCYHDDETWWICGFKSWQSALERNTWKFEGARRSSWRWQWGERVIEEGALVTVMTTVIVCPWTFFANYPIHRRHSQRTHTHPYEYTHANPTSRSIFKDWAGKSSRLTKSPQAPRCRRNVACHWKHKRR